MPLDIQIKNSDAVVIAAAGSHTSAAVLCIHLLWSTLPKTSRLGFWITSEHGTLHNTCTVQPAHLPHSHVIGWITSINASWYAINHASCRTSVQRYKWNWMVQRRSQHHSNRTTCTIGVTVGNSPGLQAKGVLDPPCLTFPICLLFMGLPPLSPMVDVWGKNYKGRYHLPTPIPVMVLE